MLFFYVVICLHYRQWHLVSCNLTKYIFVCMCTSFFVYPTIFFPDILFSTQQGSFQISDVDRLLSFTESYMLGIAMVEGDGFFDYFDFLVGCLLYVSIYLFVPSFGFSGIGGSFFSGLDAHLAPEHLLRLCLEHELKFISSCKSSNIYNFYKVLETLGPIMKCFVLIR